MRRIATILILSLIVPLLFLRWRQLVGGLFTLRINWNGVMRAISVTAC